MESLYKKYYQSVYKFVSNKVGEDEDREELTNDILLAAINSWPTFDKKSSEFTWICGIAKHKIIDFYRKKKLKTILFSVNPIFEEIADKALGPEEESLNGELKKEIKKIFGELNEGYAKILRLKYIERLSIRSMALKLGTTVKAVESKLIRAKLAFRQQWQYSKGPRR